MKTFSSDDTLDPHFAKLISGGPWFHHRKVRIRNLGWFQHLGTESYGHLLYGSDSAEKEFFWFLRTLDRTRRRYAAGICGYEGLLVEDGDPDTDAFLDGDVVALLYHFLETTPISARIIRGRIPVPGRGEGLRSDAKTIAYLKRLFCDDQFYQRALKEEIELVGERVKSAASFYRQLVDELHEISPNPPQPSTTIPKLGRPRKTSNADQPSPSVQS